MDSLPEFNIKKIETSLARELLPRDIRERSTNFVKLLEEYYAFLNAKDNPSYVINRIIDEHDIDSVVDEKYLDKIKAEIASLVPTSEYVQKAFLLKRIIDLYNLRGNEESIKYFFRVFFNENVTIYNPWDQVLIPSHGKWVQSTYMRLILVCGNEDLLRQTKLFQYDDKGVLRATLYTRGVTRKQYANQYYFDVEIQRDTVSGVFSEKYRIRNEDGTVQGYLSRMLDDIVIIDGGKGYAVGDRIYLGSMEDISFSSAVNKVDNNGTIKTIKIYNDGIASSVQYTSNVPNDLGVIPNQSEVYLKGTLVGMAPNGLSVHTNAIENNSFSLIFNSVYATETIDANAIASLYLNRPVNVHGVLTTAGLNVIKISNGATGGLFHHDFVYYAEDDSPKLNNDNAIRTLQNVVIKSNKNTRTEDRDTNLAQIGFKFGIFYETDGYYADSKGMPSGFSVLQDSFYYQVFSYEVNSSLTISKWKSPLEELIHPAGFKVFNHIRTRAEFDTELSVEQDPYVETLDLAYLPPSTVHTDTFGVSTTINFNMQDYVQDPYANGSYLIEDYVTQFINLIPLVLVDPYDTYFDSYIDAYIDNPYDLELTLGPYGDDPYTYMLTFGVADKSSVTESSNYYEQFNSYVNPLNLKFVANNGLDWDGTYTCVSYSPNPWNPDKRASNGINFIENIGYSLDFVRNDNQYAFSIVWQWHYSINGSYWNINAAVFDDQSQTVEYQTWHHSQQNEIPESIFDLWVNGYEIANTTVLTPIKFGHLIKLDAQFNPNITSEERDEYIGNYNGTYANKLYRLTNRDPSVWVDPYLE